MDMRALSRSVRLRAGVLAAAGLAAFAIYAMSCVHSPVSWSPDSSKIALTVTPTGDEPNMMGVFVYDIDSGRHRLIEAIGKNGILSAPSWSPDGKWLAFYRVEPDEERRPDERNDAAAGAAAEKRPPVIAPFGEENRVQPAFVYEALRDFADAEEAEAFEAELVIVGVDDKDRRIERTLKWTIDDNDRAFLLVLRPRWSADSRCVFYVQAFDEMGYVGSLDIATGRAEAHTFASSMLWDVSPDGTRVAACVNDSLAVSRIDKADCRYLGVPVKAEDESWDERPLTWASDSRRILLTLTTGFIVADVETGRMQTYEDTTAAEIAYPTFSADGTKVLYVAKYKAKDGDENAQAAAIRSMALASGKVETVTLLPEIDAAADNGLGSFSVSPNGRMCLVRGVVKDADGKESSCLIFWDGRKRRVVEIDSWLNAAGEVGL